jgi:myosin heavy subunit
MQLTEAKNFKYLNKSGCVTLPGVDDADDFQKVKLAMNVLRISNEDQDALFNAIAAILHMSNLEFVADKDGSKIKNVDGRFLLL